MDQAMILPMRALSMLFVAAHVAGAQTHPDRAVSGTVYDSMSQRPLAGAVVQVARVTAGDSAPQIVTAISDDAGRFRFATLPAGKFAIGFQHDALNALGIESQLRAFELGAGNDVTMDLAIGSGRAVRLERCGPDAASTGDGMIAGYVVDAQHGATLAGATVEVHWMESTVQKRGLRTITRKLTSTVAGDGTYLACGVPSDAPLEVEVKREGYRNVLGQLSVPPAGASRMDFRLSDAASVRGTAIIRGLVVARDSTALPSGDASIAALGIAGPVRNGTFSLTGVPAGTWTVEVKAIGYEPQTMFADAADPARAPTTFMLERRAQTLEAMSVVGTPGRDLRILDDMVTRNKVAMGTMFMPGNSWLVAAETPADVLRAARGFVQRSPTKVVVTGCNLGIKPVTGDATIDGKKTLAVYLDGMRLGTGLQGLQDALAMRSVLAIETYPDVQFAPFLWRTNDACAVMAVWTKR
jgi:hypothetical protein